MVSGQRISIEERVSFRGFIERFPEPVRAGLQDATIRFLDSSDAAARAYVLRQLNGRFMMQAANFDKRTVEELERSQSARPTFAVFVDTNFLFSILGLHENPSNEAAERLMWLAGILEGRVDLKFYVAPITLDEARSVMEAAGSDLRDLRLEPNVAAAAETAGDLSGMARKYVHESKSAGQALAVEEYFAPYLRNLVAVLRGKKVQIFNERMDDYRTRSDVLDDLNEQLEFQASRPLRKPKSYEALLHDMVLWHFVSDRRPAVVESLLDARFWVVTVDFRFLGFDSFKRRGSRGGVPLCVHPASLMQVLQLWVPRSEEFERALVDNFRLPFLLSEFDASAEKVTIEILRALSRFEDVGDLPEETVVSILVNEALRQKLMSEPEVERQVELVREALIEEHGRIKGDLEKSLAEAERLRKEVDAGRESEAALLEHVGALEAQLKERDQGEEIRTVRIKFAAFALVLPLLGIAVAGAAIGGALTAVTSWPWWQGSASGWILMLISWVWSIRWLGRRWSAVATWSIFRAFVNVHQFVFVTLLGALLLGVLVKVLGDVAYDYVAKLI